MKNIHTIPKEKPKQLTDLEITIKLEKIEKEESEQEAFENTILNMHCGKIANKSSCRHKWKETPLDSDNELQIYTCIKCGKQDVS